MYQEVLREKEEDASCQLTRYCQRCCFYYLTQVKK